MILNLQVIYQAKTVTKACLGYKVYNNEQGGDWKGKLITIKIFLYSEMRKGT